VLPPLVLASDVSDLEAGILLEVVPNIAALIDREVTAPAPLLGVVPDELLLLLRVPLVPELPVGTVLLVPELLLGTVLIAPEVSVVP